MPISAVLNGSRVDITLTWTYPTAYVSRVDFASGNVTPVRQAEPATLSGGTWTGYDYEAPLGKNFFYIAQYGTDQISSPVYSIPNTAREVWLRHLVEPERAVKVRLTTMPQLTSDYQRELISVLNRPAPLAISGGVRSAPTGTLELVTNSQADIDALHTILADGSVLLLQTPADYQLGGNTYISIGQVNEGSLFSKAKIPWYKFSLEFTVVERPSGTGLTIGGLLVTWDTFQNQNVSWNDAMSQKAGFGTPSWDLILNGTTTIPLAPTT